MVNVVTYIYIAYMDPMGKEMIGKMNIDTSTKDWINGSSHLGLSETR